MNGYGNFVTKLARDLMSFLQKRPDVDLEAVDNLSPLPAFDLGKARNNVKIYSRSGCRIFVTSLTGTASIRTRLAGQSYPLFKGSMSFPFRELYLTNTAQAGKSLTMIIGLQSFVDIDAQPEFTPTEKVKLQESGGGIINPATKEDITTLEERIIEHRGNPGDPYYYSGLGNIKWTLSSMNTNITELRATRFYEGLNALLRTITLANTLYSMSCATGVMIQMWAVITDGTAFSCRWGSSSAPALNTLMPIPANTIYKSPYLMPQSTSRYFWYACGEADKTLITHKYYK